MPTENDTKLDDAYLCEQKDGEWRRIGNIGKLSQMPVITLTEDECFYGDISLNSLLKGIAGTIEFDLLGEKLTNKKKKCFRNAFGIDLLSLRFPKKKNRRRKRLRRRAEKWLRSLS